MDLPSYVEPTPDSTVSRNDRLQIVTRGIGQVVGHGIARGDKKPITYIHRGPINPKNWDLKVGNHLSFVTMNPFRSRSVSRGSLQFSKITIKVP